MLIATAPLRRSWARTGDRNLRLGFGDSTISLQRHRNALSCCHRTDFVTGALSDRAEPRKQVPARTTVVQPSSHNRVVRLPDDGQSVLSTLLLSIPLEER